MAKEFNTTFSFEDKDKSIDTSLQVIKGKIFFEELLEESLEWNEMIEQALECYHIIEEPKVDDPRELHIPE